MDQGSHGQQPAAYRVARHVSRTTSSATIDLATAALEESTMSDEVDRSELPIPDPTFTGTIHRTLEGSVPDWNIVAAVEPPQGAPNYSRVSWASIPANRSSIRRRVAATSGCSSPSAMSVVTNDEAIVAVSVPRKPIPTSIRTPAKMRPPTVWGTTSP